MLIIIGILFTIFIIIKFNDHKFQAEIKSQKDAFWKREQEANATRKKDIGNLDYIHIPYDMLPFADTTNEILNQSQKTLKSLEAKPIVNLTGYTNTDLKLLYGTAHINYLMGCDSNYLTLIKTVYKWGFDLHQLGYHAQALTVLEYGVTIKTDIKKHYLLLGELYKSLKEYDKIDELIRSVEELNITSKDSTINALKELKMSYYLG